MKVRDAILKLAQYDPEARIVTSEGLDIIEIETVAEHFGENDDNTVVFFPENI